MVRRIGSRERKHCKINLALSDALDTILSTCMENLRLLYNYTSHLSQILSPHRAGWYYQYDSYNLGCYFLLLLDRHVESGENENSANQFTVWLVATPWLQFCQHGKLKIVITLTRKSDIHTEQVAITNMIVIIWVVISCSGWADMLYSSLLCTLVCDNFNWQWSDQSHIADKHDCKQSGVT